jgi:type IV secretion system protein TrbL
VLAAPARSNPANLRLGEVLTNENASQLETRPAAARLAGVLFVGRPRRKSNSAGLFDDVLNRYNAAASGWAGVITNAASWLFWTLVVISMVWTFGMMALRKADIGEFFAEFVRFTIFTGFFWWLLTNGPNFASTIYASLRQIAGNATGLGQAAVAIRHCGCGLCDLLQGDGSVLGVVAGGQHGRHPHGRAILVVLALVGVNMLLLLASGWVLAYGGVFFLGFGGRVGLPTWRSTTTRPCWAWPRSSWQWCSGRHRQDLPR